MTTRKRLATAAAVLAALAALAATSHAAEFAFFTTTDFSSGSSSTIDLTTKSASINVASIHSDASARFYDGRIYVVNRFGADNIQILDPGNSFSTVAQHSTGNGTNPHDIVVVSATKAYITRYDASSLLIMNPSTGAHTGSIDFSTLADADGLPEMDSMFLFRDHLFVSVQRLDRNVFFSPSGTSYLSVIDINTDLFVDTNPGLPGTQHFTLANANPFSELQLDVYTGNLYVACVNFLGLLDGGVEFIDPETRVSQGVVFTETAAGGDILDVEIVAPDKGFAIISNASFFTDLITFNPQTGVKTGTVYAPGDYVLQDIDRAPTGELFLTDRTTTAPGVRCYDVVTSLELTSGPIDVGLPPFDITFSLEIQTGVEDAPPSIATLGQNYPNPFNPTTTIPYSLSAGGDVVLEVFDIGGRHVRTLVSATIPAGSYSAQWDGRDGRGALAGSGIYFARLSVGDAHMVQKLLLLK